MYLQQYLIIYKLQCVYVVQIFIQIQYWKDMIFRNCSIFFHFIVIILFVSSSRSQNTTDTNKLQLVLGTQKRLDVEAKKPVNLTLAINSEPRPGQKLFITAQSPFNDPFEQPSITVRSDNNFLIDCVQQGSNFVGICQIDTKQLKLNRTFTIQFSCEVNCNLLVTTYLSQLYEVDLGNDINLKNPQNKSATLSFVVKIPENQNFTSYYLLAKPNNIDQQVQGATIVANYGGSQVKQPTISLYKVKAQKVSGHRLGIFLSSDQVKAGEKIYFLALLPPYGDYSVDTNIINGIERTLKIGIPVLDFTAPSQSRIYSLNIQQLQNDKPLSQIIKIKFITYSGSPSVYISPERQFNKSTNLVSWVNSNTQVYQITPQLRKQKNNFKMLYIKIQSFWSSNFYLEASINRKSFVDLELQVMQSFDMPANSIKNLIFSDQNLVNDLPSDGIVEYKIQLSSFDYPVQFMIRNCGKDANARECLIQKSQDLNQEEVKKSFKSIQLTKQSLFSRDIVKFSHKVTQLCSPDFVTTPTKYTCLFNIVLQNTRSQGKNVEVELQVNKDTIKKWLKQGKPYRDEVSEGQTNYYAFELGDITKIRKLQFYLTTIQGDAFLMVSKNISYPTVDDILKAGNDVQYSLWDSVILEKQDIKATTYHIGIYGDSAAEYSIGVAISRQTNQSGSDSNNSVEVTQIMLQKGEVQTISFPKGKQASKFSFTPLKDKQKSIIKINDIQGLVNYSISEKQNVGTILCDSKTIKDQMLDACEIQTKIGYTYIVSVTGKLDEVQIFTILYTSQQQCNSYPWNFPLKLLIKPDEQACLSYSLNQLDSFRVQFSMSPLQILTSTLQISIKFDTKTIPFKGKQVVISKKQLQLLCPSPQKAKCRFLINIKNPTTPKTNATTMELFLAVQRLGGENVLFNQVAEQITSEQLSTKKADLFFYYIYEKDRLNDIEVIVSSQTLSMYQVSARVVKNSQFVKDINLNLYPKFNEKQTDVLSVNSSQYSYLTILTIPQQLFATTSDENVATLLISVYGIAYDPLKSQSYSPREPQMYVYKIQINQGTNRLQLGQSKLGNTYKDSFTKYEIKLNNNQVSFLEIRAVDNNQCVQAYMQTVSPSTIRQIPNNMAFTNESGIRLIFIKTSEDYCSYQISFYSAGLPVTSLLVNAPYQVSLSGNNVKYFIYYHQNRQSLYILQMIKTGNSYIYAQSMNTNATIKDVMNKSLTYYTYKSSLNGNLEITPFVFNYCSRCFYVIAVEGEPNVTSQITINSGESPMLLREEVPLKDQMLSNQTNKYQYYIKRNHSILFTMLYGQIEVKVFDPNGKVIAESKQISKVQQFKITVLDINTNNKNYFDDSSRYVVSVRALSSANFYIQTRKQKISLKAYEGVPLTFEIIAQNNITQVQFSSVTSQNQEVLNFLVEDLNFYNQGYFNIIKFEVYQRGNLIFIQKFIQSEGSYNIQVKLSKGQYNLSITAQKSTNLTVIMAKKSFNHLIAGRTAYMENPSVFQVFSTGDSLLIQVFTCSQLLKIRASSRYDSLFNDSIQFGVLELERENLGGHYVLHTQNIYGQFFVLVTNDQQDLSENNKLSYQITYHFFNPLRQQVIPYKIYDIQSLQIAYQYALGGINFYLKPIKSKNNQLNNNLTAIYKLFISVNRGQIESVASCSIGVVYTETLTLPINSSPVEFKISTDKLKQIIGESELYYVGAEATLLLNQERPANVREAFYVYEISQLLSTNQFQPRATYIFKVRDVFVWIVLPFLFGAIVLFFAARYLIRAFSAYPTQLVEEEPPAADSENALKNKEVA